MTLEEAERELASAIRDLSNASKYARELNQKLVWAEQWVSAAIAREHEATFRVRLLSPQEDAKP